MHARIYCLAKMCNDTTVHAPIGWTTPCDDNRAFLGVTASKIPRDAGCVPQVLKNARLSSHGVVHPIGACTVVSIHILARQYIRACI